MVWFRAIVVRKAQAQLEQKAWNKLSPADRCMFAAPIKPLKLIIMSATLRVDDFLSPTLFSTPPPIVKVEARQFPVTPHFARRTEMNNYLREAFKKVLQIHKRLPEGGILVFLTGKREIMHFTRKLRQRLNKNEKQLNASLALNQETDEFSVIDQVDVGMWDTAEEQADVYDDLVHGVKGGPRKKRLDNKRMKVVGERGRNDDLADVDTDSDLASLDGLSDDDDDDVKEPSAGGAGNETGAEGSIEQTSNKDEDEETVKRRELLMELLRGGASGGTVPKDDSGDDPIDKGLESTNLSADRPAVDAEPRPKLKALVLPLFAMLTPDQQRRVFEPVPDDTRLIVIATNVAETSITIPGIKYVVDCGRQKEKTFDAVSGISKYEVRWICKASADQRMGRAGRTGPGHCYRLYRYEHI
jgi:ATP-dependent RNA helicase DHX37/DHR1